MKISTKARNAIFLGTLCSISYFAVYIARNVLSAVSKNMENSGIEEEYILSIAAVFSIFYAVGQLINGFLGERIKAKYMISIGLLLAGISNFVFPLISHYRFAAMLAYAATGFFLSMIYCPMTKVVSESTDLTYATRCSVGYTFASFFATPAASALAIFLSWQAVFSVSSITLIIMAILCFTFFTIFERKDIVKYPRFQKKEKQIDKAVDKNSSATKILLKRKIARYSVVSMLTGIIRTSVISMLILYYAKCFNYSSDDANTINLITSPFIAFTVFIAIFLYERVGKNLDKSVLIFFAVAAACFITAYFITNPIIHIIVLIFGIMASNSAASALWSIYCPSLGDTGYVSTATGFLDFLSYMASAAFNLIWAAFLPFIGWQKLPLITFGLMIIGVIVCLPFKRKKAPEEISDAE